MKTKNHDHFNISEITQMASQASQEARLGLRCPTCLETYGGEAGCVCTPASVLPRAIEEQIEAQYRKAYDETAFQMRAHIGFLELVGEG